MTLVVTLQFTTLSPTRKPVPSLFFDRILCNDSNIGYQHNTVHGKRTTEEIAELFHQPSLFIFFQLLVPAQRLNSSLFLSRTATPSQASLTSTDHGVNSVTLINTL